jgi:hypothetical protein
MKLTNKEILTELQYRIDELNKHPGYDQAHAAVQFRRFKCWIETGGKAGKVGELGYAIPADPDYDRVLHRPKADAIV